MTLYARQNRASERCSPQRNPGKQAARSSSTAPIHTTSPRGSSGANTASTVISAFTTKARRSGGLMGASTKNWSSMFSLPKCAPLDCRKGFEGLQLEAGALQESVEDSLVVRRVLHVGHVHAALQSSDDCVRVGHSVSNDGGEWFAPASLGHATWTVDVSRAREWSDNLWPQPSRPIWPFESVCSCTH